MCFVSALWVTLEKGCNGGSAGAAGALAARGGAARTAAGHGLFLGHSHQSLWRGRLKFSLQTAVDVCWLPPRSNAAMHLHSQHSVVFVLKD